MLNADTTQKGCTSAHLMLLLLKPTSLSPCYLQILASASMLKDDQKNHEILLDSMTCAWPSTCQPRAMDFFLPSTDAQASYIFELDAVADK